MNPHRVGNCRVLAAAAAVLFVGSAIGPAVCREETDYRDFDQTPHHGWRALSDQKQFHEAAAAIDAFLAAHPGLDQSRRTILQFHAAQALAIGGDTRSALEHLPLAKTENESPWIRWNDYVDATAAFLKGDLPSLQAARARIAAGPTFHGEAPNLDVVDRLIAHFGKTYAEAYLGDAPAGKKEGRPPPQHGAVAGIGAALRLNDGVFTIGAIAPDSSAAATQVLHQGDRILAVAEDGQIAQPVTGRSMEDVVAMIRGKEGSNVWLLTVAPGADESTAREVMLPRWNLGFPGGLFIDPKPLPPGAAAPDLSYLRLSDGKTASLAAAHRGRIVVLEFWATWCPPCQLAMTDLQKIAAKFAAEKAPVDFLSMSIDDPSEMSELPATIDKVATHLKDKGWKDTINGWSTLDARKAWHISGVPTQYVIGADGKIAALDPEHLEETLANLLAKAPGK